MPIPTVTFPIGVSIGQGAIKISLAQLTDKIVPLVGRHIAAGRGDLLTQLLRGKTYPHFRIPRELRGKAIGQIYDGMAFADPKKLKFTLDPVKAGQMARAIEATGGELRKSDLMAYSLAEIISKKLPKRPDMFDMFEGMSGVFSASDSIHETFLKLRELKESHKTDTNFLIKITLRILSL